MATTQRMSDDWEECLLDEDMRHTSKVLSLIDANPKSAAEVAIFELSSAVTLAKMYGVDVPREVAKLLAGTPLASRRTEVPRG